MNGLDLLQDGRLRGLDLFSGGGLLALALSPWVRPVAYCEWEPYACGVLMSRMADNQLPTAPIWDDATTLQPQDLEGLGPLDIFTGGFPCQDISLAGTGEGLAGERSGLWSEIYRLAGALRPPFIFLENVPAIRTRGADVVAGQLARIGYDARWLTLSAADVGAPHRRKRWWCLAANPDSIALRIESEWDQLDTPISWDAFVGGARRARSGGSDSGAGGGLDRTPGFAADSDGGGLAIDGEGFNHDRHQPHWHDADRRDPTNYWQENRPPFPAVRGVDDGSTHRVEQLALLGNAIVTEQARVAFAVLMGLAPWEIP